MRLLTALAIIGLCAFAVFRGWSIARFAEARESMYSLEHRSDAFRQWIGVPGLTGAALEASLTQVATVTDIDGARRRADDLAALLSVRPSSSTGWLSLAGMRFVAGQPYREVLAALKMSFVTGPNEADLMLQRGIFGLLQWEALPLDVCNQTIRDLAGAILGDAVEDSRMSLIRNILGMKSAAIRSQIASLLQAEGVPEAQLVRMGL